jgi:hypothetical protein
MPRSLRRAPAGCSRVAAGRTLGVIACVLLVGCSGDAPTAPPATPPPADPPPPAEPVTPVISAPARLHAGTLGTASISSQTSSTYAWTVEGGEIVSGAGTTQITFRSHTAGPIRLSATVTNAVGQASTPGEVEVRSYTTLSVVRSTDVEGGPAAGVTEYESPDTVALNFAPGAGAGSVVVEVDGVAAPAGGSLVMDRNRTLWAYGQPATGTAFPDMIVVPNDPTIIPDLAFYMNRPAVTATVADPYCGVVTPNVAYPRSYLGDFPLPEPTNEPLGSAVQRGVSLKDYWAFINNNPTTNDGCSSDWHAAVDESIRRVRRLGADYVAIYQNAYLEDVNADRLKFTCVNNQGCPSWAQIPDSEILWAAERARAHGLQLYLFMQVDHHDIAGGNFPATPSDEWLHNFFDAYKEYMLHIGALAEQAGIPVMQVDWGVWWMDWTRPEHKPLYQARMTEVAQAVRSVYSGKRALGALSIHASDSQALMDEVDLMLLELWQIRFYITPQENANLTPALVRDKTREWIQGVGTVVGKYQKPTIFRILAQSQRDFLQSGWIEDGFCTPGCPQRDVQIDFSVQAITYQGQLEAIQSQSTFPLFAVDAMGYWFADVMLPKESFPNLSQSIRNKPAERIIYHWFRR